MNERSPIVPRQPAPPQTQRAATTAADMQPMSPSVSLPPVSPMPPLQPAVAAPAPAAELAPASASATPVDSASAAPVPAETAMSAHSEPAGSGSGGGLPASAAMSPAARPPAPPRALGRELRGPARLGLAIIVAFFGIGGTWSATAPIGGAAIAPGLISPDSSRKRIQHLEGGIIREIKIREGDHVEAGQPLMILEGVSTQAEVAKFESRLRQLAAAEARLRAERTGAKTIQFNHPSLADRSNPEVKAVIEQEVNQFNTRRENDEGQISVLHQRIAQLDQQIVGAERQIVAVRRQTELIREEIIAKQDLVDKGLLPKPRLLEVQRMEANLLGEDGELVARVAQSQEQIGQTKLQMLSVKTQRTEEVDKSLAETQTNRNEIEALIRDSRDRLARTTIVAPTAGTVLDMKFKTIGGVIRPGEEVMTVVPFNDELIVDAKIATRDVDDVHAGQSGYVIFPSFPQRNLHRIDAKVRTVSADAMADERTGEHFYTAKVQVDREQLHRLDPNIELQPGMPAEVFISTQPRTVLDYLIQPYMVVIERSMREH